tara:strand:+ start:24 stop:815 length:792 start_codon:yes stop_codon:yes gene_type:complete
MYENVLIPINFVVAIPSYNRSESISKKTLKCLKDNNIPQDKIFIFVADEYQKKLYQEKNPDYKNIIVSQIGLCNSRNFIIDYFKEDQPILFMDDDVSKFIYLDKEKTINEKQESHIMKGDELIDFVNDAFIRLKLLDLFIFGLYPASNSFFMKKKVDYDLKFLVGSVYGIINRHKMKGDTILGDEKEDYSRTIQYFLEDKKIIRYNYVSPVTTYYKGVGGMVENRTYENQLKACNYLLDKYPQFFKIDTRKKKSEYPEIKFIC